jgi:hypothetical protein
MSFLATNLQTAYIEFNTVQEAEEWMTLTQVQTKNLNIPSFLFLSIGGSVVFDPMDDRICI